MLLGGVGGQLHLGRLRCRCSLTGSCWCCFCKATSGSSIFGRSSSLGRCSSNNNGSSIRSSICWGSKRSCCRSPQSRWLFSVSSEGRGVHYGHVYPHPCWRRSSTSGCTASSASWRCC